MSTGLPAEMKVAADASHAEWLMDRLWPWPTPHGHLLAGSLVPEGLPAYAAIRYASGLEDDLSAPEVRALVGALIEFSGTVDSCWFCLWAGYGGLDLRGTDHALVRQPQREYLLLRGPLSAVLNFDDLRPQFWWPDDHCWCVGSDMDLARSFVAGPEELIDALDRDDELDVERVPLDVRVDETNHLSQLARH